MAELLIFGLKLIFGKQLGSCEIVDFFDDCSVSESSFCTEYIAGV